MNEKKKSMIIVAVMIGFLLLLLLFCIIQKPKDQNHGIVDETKPEYSGKYTTDYESVFEGEGKKVLFVGSSTCGVCSEFTPYMKYLSETYDFTYYYIDAATINTVALEEVLEKIGKSIDDIGTPYMAFIENGKKYEELKGYASEAALFKVLQENGIIKEEETYVSSTDASNGSSEDSAYTSLSFIDYDKYKEIYDSKEKSIVVVGQTGCGACTAFKPVINEIAKEYHVTIYFVNLTDWTESETYDLLNSLSYFKDRETFGTPLTLIIENGDNIAEQEGHNTKETTVSFLKKHDLIKEN